VVLERLGWIALGFVLSLGTFRAFQMGGNDFAVFHSAWRTVLSGAGANVYHSTPDRFLYAPGFAWLFCWMGLLPEKVALGVWSLGKVAALLSALVLFSRMLGKGKGILCWGLLIFARPIVIDLQYGQVNLLILVMCCWALYFLLKADASKRLRATAWLMMGIVCACKPIALPLLAVPWVMRARTVERSASIAGVLLALLSPAVSVGLAGALALIADWKTALFQKGIPLETHNQSFGGFLERVLGDSPSPYIALEQKLALGQSWLSGPTLKLVAVAWSLITLGLLSAFIFRGPQSRGKSDQAFWIALVIGMLVLPSHLVWKPYFVFGIPAAICAVSAVRTWKGAAFLAALLAVVNFTGFDLIGYYWAPRFEAYSSWLFVHLALLIFSAQSRQRAAAAG
jgi:hypothetical protein